MSTAAEIAAAFGGRSNGTGWIAHCPCHGDEHPSLSIGEGAGGKPLLCCHAGCPQDRLASEVKRRGLSLDGKPGRRPARRIDVAYDYRNEHGEVVYQAVRWVPKDFRQRRPNGKGGWINDLDGVTRLPYKLPELITTPIERVIFIPEGEKDVDRLRSLGLASTCNSEGAGKWRPAFAQFFAGRDVVILSDNDDAGHRHAQAIAENLAPVARRVRVVELPDLPPKGDVSDWLDAGNTVHDLRRLARAAPTWEPREPERARSETDPVEGVMLDDFYSYMPAHSYLFTPTGETWPAGSVNARISPVPLLDAEGNPVVDRDGKPVRVAANAWLDRNRPVEQMTWWPGQPELIADRLTSHAGWIERKGARVFNLYRGPSIVRGNAAEAKVWLEHVERVFPDDRDHIIRWLAHRVQRPGDKINHAIVAGGAQGIGKDSLLEPVKRAIGPWNWHDIAPSALSDTFNPFAKSVILRINEAHDLGDLNRYQFYEAIKAYTAAPPDVLRVNDKHIRQFYVMNVCGVIVTTNHRTDGIYLPADDRRHYVAWSNLTKEGFAEGYWKKLWRWYEAGGFGHVAAYLAGVDISAFDAKAPPPKTPAFWEIVNAGRAPEEDDLAGVLDKLKNPRAFVLDDLADAAPPAFADWLRDRRNRRAIPHRLESCGYARVHNPDAKSGLWQIHGERQAVYARGNLTVRDQIEAARHRRRRDDDR